MSSMMSRQQVANAISQVGLEEQHNGLSYHRRLYALPHS